MPIYEYKCKDCGAHIERRQGINEETLKVCEKCSGPLEKQWSRTGFQFKGDGWYVTDYAAKKPASGGESGSEKSSGGESTASSDTASNKQSEKPAAPKADSSTKSD